MSNTEGPPNDKQRQTRRLAQAAIVALAAVVIVTIWLGGKKGRAPEPEQPSAPPRSQLSALPSAAAAPLTPTRASRPVVATATFSKGFGPPERVDSRDAVSTTMATAELEVEIHPDADPVVMTMLAKAGPKAPPSQKLTVQINGKEGGVLPVGADWGPISVTLPAASWVDGKNTLTLSSDAPTGQILFDRVWFQLASSWGTRDLGEAHVRAALGEGWGEDAVAGGRSSVKLAASPAQVSVNLRPLPVDYALALVGRDFASSDQGGSVSVSVGSVELGAAEFPHGWDTRVLVVPRGRLRDGNNVVDFKASSLGRVALDRLELVPIGDRLLVDVGDPSMRAYLADGFSVDEGGPGGSTAWSDAPVSRFAIPLAPSGKPYRLSVHARTLSPLAPLAADVRVNGEKVGTVAFTEEFQTLDVTVPPGRLTHGANRIEFAYAKTGQPHDLMPGSKDTRELAARFDWLDIQPTP